MDGISPRVGLGDSAHRAELAGGTFRRERKRSERNKWGEFENRKSLKLGTWGCVRPRGSVSERARTGAKAGFEAARRAGGILEKVLRANLGRRISGIELR